MKQSAIPAKVPVFLHKFFWDVDAERINPRESPEYVINRLLDKGDLQAARWVLKSYPKVKIRETFKIRRDFSPWNGTFWAKYLNIPKEDVACLKMSYRKMRKQLWPY